MTKTEKIEIIQKIIEIWGSLTNEIFDCHIVLDNIKVNKKFNDKYNIVQVIERYNLNNVVVVIYSDGNVLADVKMKYDKLSDDIIEKILKIIIEYDSIMMRR